MIRIIRTALSINQNALAQQSGISRQALNEIESGRAQPRTDTLFKIVRVFSATYRAIEVPLPNSLDAIIREFLRNPLGLPDDPMGPIQPPPRGRKPKADLNYKAPESNSNRAPLPEAPVSAAADIAAARSILARFAEHSAKLRGGVDDGSINNGLTLMFARALAPLSMSSFDERAWVSSYCEYAGERPQFFGAIVRELIASHPLYRRAKTETAIKSFLSERRYSERLAKGKSKPVDQSAKQRRIDAVIELYGHLIKEDMDNPHSKGGPLRAWMDDLPRLRGAISVLRPRLEVILKDAAPAVETFQRWAREWFGKADKFERVKKQKQHAAGWKFQYAGETWFIDGTGIPYVVDGVEAPADRTGKIHHNIYTCSDCESSKTDIAWLPGRSEQDGWSDALLHFLRLAGYAPRWIICDRIGKLFKDLGGIKPNEHDALTEGVVACLAAGILPYVHAADQPTAGGVVESNNKVLKNHLAELGFARLLMKRMGGETIKSARHYTKEEFESDLVREERMHNSGSELNRKSVRMSRSQLFLHEESAIWRGTRQLAADWQLTLKTSVMPLRRVVRIAGGEISYRRDGRYISAHVGNAIQLEGREAYALALPGGMMRRDADLERSGEEIIRVALAIPGKGMPHYQVVDTRADKYTFFGKPESMPYSMTGHPVNLPDTIHDVHAKRREAAAKVARNTQALFGKAASMVEETAESAFDELKRQLA